VSHKNVIELNGKLYDASTGHMVEPHSKTAHQNIAKPTVIKPSSPGAVMDGFTRGHTAPKTAPKTHASKKVRSVSGHISAHAPKRSHTLMRRGLKKPQNSLITEEPVDAVPQTDRLTRAKATPKSSLISKFGSFRFTSPQAPNYSISKKVAPIAVKPAPAHHTSPATRLAQNRVHHAAATHTTKHSSEALVSAAIKRARTDESPHIHHHAKKHRVAHKLGVSHKAIQIGTGLLAIVVIASFIAFQNAPNLSMRLAATRAGFDAAIPAYRPSGFALNGPIEYGPGQVTLNFRSNSDERNFHVTQRVSNWTSESLLNNFVTANHKSYQSYQENGRTIYIYDGSNATWVNAGVWYQIEGNSSLTSDQLIRIANSI
jgi:hypothetical protein